MATFLRQRSSGHFVQIKGVIYTHIFGLRVSYSSNGYCFFQYPLPCPRDERVLSYCSQCMYWSFVNDFVYLDPPPGAHMSYSHLVALRHDLCNRIRPSMSLKVLKLSEGHLSAKEVCRGARGIEDLGYHGRDDCGAVRFLLRHGNHHDPKCTHQHHRITPAWFYTQRAARNAPTGQFYNASPMTIHRQDEAEIIRNLTPKTCFP